MSQIITSKRERTRNAIIQAAMLIIADKGLLGTSIDELMELTGMARGTFYNYFQTREELLDTVIEKVRDDIHEFIFQNLPENIPTNAVVACVMYGIMRYSLEHPCFGRVLVRLGTDIDFFRPPNEDDHRFMRSNIALMNTIGRNIPFAAAQIYTIGSVDSLLRHLLLTNITFNQAEQTMMLILRGIGIAEK